MRILHDEAGSSLIEVLIASGILVVALVSLAQLFATATRDNVNARATTYATILAAQKVEELRAGSPVPSPANALTANTPGYVDYLDQSGLALGGDAQPPANTVFTRRWSIDPLPADPDNVLVIQVLVTRNAAGAIQSADSRLISAKARTTR